MIDTKKLRQALGAVQPEEVEELLDRLEEAEKERDEMLESKKWYQRRCELMQEQQSKMRDPERTMVCDILANGALMHADFAGDRYAIPSAKGE